MKLFLIEQTEKFSYDSHAAAVVCAPDEDTARGMHPGGNESYWKEYRNGGWASSPKAVRVTYVGEARPDMPPGVVLDSFIAG